MKTAVLLMSMGGPSSLKDVRPFLFNLFNDPAILRTPAAVRYPLAKLISFKREKEACEIYRKIGGYSPLLENTQAQAAALEKELGEDHRCFVGMSYSEPSIGAAMKEIKKEAPDRIVLLPLYPQYSTTTTASVLREAHKAAQKEGIKQPLIAIENFYENEGFIAAFVELIREKEKQAHAFGKPVLLFSAHGLPERIVTKGNDPYPYQCWETMKNMTSVLKSGSEAVLCYQSRVGPMKWIEPYIEDEIDRAAGHKRPIVVIPLSFVSEHSETMVELGMVYRERALLKGAPFYDVVPTVGIHPAFIKGLARKIHEN